MFKVGGILSQESFNGGLNTQSDPFSLQPSESPYVKNVDFNEDASLSKRKGREKLNTTVTGAEDYCNGLFDFGVSVGVRKLIGQFGTTIYKMDDLDGTWDSLLTSRNNCLNYFDRISGYLVNATEDKEILKYWDGATASMSTLNANAPRAKFIGEFNGYMLAMNTSSNAKRVYYELTSTMLTGDWSDYFTLPSSSDDEVYWGLELRNRYYISLRNMWYRLSFVGGEAVFDYKPVLSATVGCIPRTAKVVTIPNTGEVIMYLGWDKKIWIFDGTSAQPISIKYEQNNNESSIFLDNINQAQLRNCHAKTDTNRSIYHLHISNGDSGTINVRLDINYKTMSCSPHTNQDFLSAVLAEDTLGRKYIIGGDYNGTAYIINRGNMDELPLNNIEIGADGSLTSIEGYVVNAGGVVSNKIHDGGDDKAYAEDTSENFTNLGVAVEDLLRNKEDQCQGVITAISNGGGTNAKLECSGGLSGGTGNDFDDDDTFNVYKAVFLSNNHSMYIGSKVKFDTIVIDLQQFGSATIVPTIEYSTSGTISSSATADGGASVEFTCSTTHGLSTGDYVLIAGTTDYNGLEQITVTSATKFKIVDAYVSNQSGTWSGYTALTVASNDLSDGTKGFTQSGVITLTPPSGWTATAKDDEANNFNDTTTYYYIKIQRTANTLTTTPKLNKVNIGLRIDDIYTSPKVFGKRLADVKKPQNIDFYFEPTSSFKLRFYDRVDYQRSWTEGQKRPISVSQFNDNDDFLGTFTLGTDTLGSTKTLVRYACNAQGVNNCYQYKLTSNKSYSKRWKLYKVDLGENILGVGNSRPMTRV